MDSKDFFGAPDPQDMLSKPSVLSLVAGNCAEDFRKIYFATSGGDWYSREENHTAYRVSEDRVLADVRAWVKGLEGGSVIGRRITDMIGSHPGWADIVASRVIRELRKWPEG